MSSVPREFEINIGDTISPGVFPEPNPVKADLLAPTNSLLLGGTARTSTEAGRTATVKAGEDIRPALESLKSAGGGTLILLAGTHVVSYDLIGASKVSIIGEGSSQTIIAFTMVSNSSFQLNYTNCTDFSISNLSLTVINPVPLTNFSIILEIDNSSAFRIENVNVSGGTRGISLQTVSQGVLTNVNCSSNSNIGLYIDTSNTVLFQNCSFSDNDAYGFRGSGVTTALSLINCLGNDNPSGFGISFTSDCTNIKLFSCTANANVDGFNIEGSNIVFIACTANDNTSDGFYTEISGDNNQFIACDATGNTGLDFNITDNSTLIGVVARSEEISIQDEIGLSIANRNTSTLGHKQIRWMKNTRGVSVSEGNVVTFKAAAAGNEITVSTIVGDDLVFGMAMALIANNAVGPVLVEGYTTKLKVDGTTDIAIGDFLCTYSVAGIAAKAAAGDMAFAIALEAYTTDDSNGVIDALIISPRKI